VQHDLLLRSVRRRLQICVRDETFPIGAGRRGRYIIKDARNRILIMIVDVDLHSLERHPANHVDRGFGTEFRIVNVDVKDRVSKTQRISQLNNWNGTVEVDSLSPLWDRY